MQSRNVVENFAAIGNLLVALATYVTISRQRVARGFPERTRLSLRLYCVGRGNTEWPFLQEVEGHQFQVSWTYLPA